MSAPQCTCAPSILPSFGRPCPVHGSDGGAEVARLRRENQRLRALYENVVENRERFGFTINHLLECEEALRVAEVDFSEFDRLREVLSDVDAAVALLPAAGRDAYDAAQRSVREAKRSAQENEARRRIG